MSFGTLKTTIIAITLVMAGAAHAETVLITGSNRGIGFAFAKAYADKGWTVIATSHAQRRR